MSAHRSSTDRWKNPTTRLLAAFVAVLLLVSACGSSDGDGTPVASSGEPTDGEEAVPTTAPVFEPTETPTSVPPTTQPTTTPPTTAPEPSSTPTAVPTAEQPTTAPTAPPSDTIPVETPDLVGKDWFVQAVDSTSRDLQPRPTGAVARVRFNADGTVTGNAACNNFSAQYAIDGAALTITDFAITEMACFIPDWSAFVELLPLTTGYGSAGGPDPILFVGSDSSISLGSAPPQPNQPGPTTPVIAEYIGLTEIEAAQLADTQGVAFRVSSIDGEPRALTMDYVEDRVNVDLVDGVVVGGTLG